MIIYWKTQEESAENVLQQIRNLVRRPTQEHHGQQEQRATRRKFCSQQVQGL